MKKHFGVHAVLASAIAVTTWGLAGTLARAQTPLALESARITIDGTSNVHPYTASTTAVRVTRGRLASGIQGPDLWANALQPGGVDAFEVAVPAGTLTSPREGIDKNMHKALLVDTHPDITFRLLRVEPGAAATRLRAVGVLSIAGVEREVTFEMVAEIKDSTLCVHGQTELLMTDFGIKPPTAMLGMLKTDPKVTVKFDAVLAIPLT